MLSIALGVGTYFVTAHAQERHLGSFGMHGTGPGMMGMMGPGMMGMAHDERTQAELQVIHTMFINHYRIKRTVENLPNGIRTVTESDDPALADLIKKHVAEMGSRVVAGDDPGLPIESDSRSCALPLWGSAPRAECSSWSPREELPIFLSRRGR